MKKKTKTTQRIEKIVEIIGNCQGLLKEIDKPSVVVDAVGYLLPVARKEASDIIVSKASDDVHLMSKLEEVYHISVVCQNLVDREKSLEMEAVFYLLREVIENADAVMASMDSQKFEKAS